MERLTNGVGTERWIEITKGYYISAYVPGNTLDNLTEGLGLTKEGGEEEFSGKDFEKAVK